MRIYLKTLAALFMLIGFVPVAFCENGPKISFDSLNHDFGEVIHGTSPIATFQVTNVGDEPLVIEKVRSSCGCARAIKGKRELGPGERTTIEAKILTNGLKKGNHHKSIYVHSNDRGSPVVQLRLKFCVFRHLSLDPPYLAVSLLKLEERVTFRVKATNHWTAPIHVKAGPPDKSGRTVTIIPEDLVVPPGRTASFEISIPTASPNRRGFLMGTACLETDAPKEKTLEMRYMIKLPKDYAAAGT